MMLWAGKGRTARADYSAARMASSSRLVPFRCAAIARPAAAASPARSAARIRSWPLIVDVYMTSYSSASSGRKRATRASSTARRSRSKSAAAAIRR
jgi:hypothetical protein